MATKRRGKIDEGKRAPRILGRRDFIGATGLAVTATLGRGVSAAVPGQAARPTQPEGMDDDSSGGSKWGAHLKRTPFSLNEPNVPSRILWIGTLQGTWKEMGIQYGQRAAKDITQHWDHDWEDRVIDNRGFWAKSRTPEARQAYRLAYLERAWKELSEFSPELIDFFKGMAEGAAPELDKCHYAKIAPHHLKILYLNESEVAIHPNWDFDTDRPGPPRPRTTAAAGEAESYENNHDNQADGCNGYWATGTATANGHTLAQRAVQGGLGRTVTAVSYVAIPRDPKARVFWGMGRAGALGGLGGGLLNDHGVCVLTAGSQGGPADETLAPGIKDFILGAYGVIFSKTAKEAAERMTVGTPEYRKATERKTVLRFRGANVVFGDPNEAYAVESNARHYLIRKPGDLGEKDRKFLVIANHFLGKTSYDDKNQLRNDKPMSAFEPGEPGSVCRYWTGYWWLTHNFGKITAADAREFAGAHFAYDESGALFEVDAQTGWQTSKPGTWCAHRIAKGEGPGTDHPIGSDGNHMSSVFDLTTREVWFVPAWTCHYQAWNMNWHYVDLKPYAEYRQKVWRI